MYATLKLYWIQEQIPYDYYQIIMIIVTRQIILPAKQAEIEIIGKRPSNINYQ